ncbi:hypothetical protein EW146_g9561 [Bondarzewia mesenterica]|uniref:RNA polymerase II transcription factor B subunit 5 n=1 Tax=Bondarzewia mesenterica TaxID=1095465 RepID=A0A4S4L5P3_9AGAM|nr:hypothetical protein EW146_g9561 [Bondarzewia mesenterica]
MRAIRGVLFTCDSAVKQILLTMNEKQSFIIEDLDDYHVMVKADEEYRVRKELEAESGMTGLVSSAMSYLQPYLKLSHCAVGEWELELSFRLDINLAKAVKRVFCLVRRDWKLRIQYTPMSGKTGISHEEYKLIRAARVLSIPRHPIACVFSYIRSARDVGSDVDTSDAAEQYRIPKLRPWRTVLGIRTAVHFEVMTAVSLLEAVSHACYFFTTSRTSPASSPRASSACPLYCLLSLSETALQAARKDLGGYVLQAQREFNKLSVTPENATAGPSTSRDAPSTSEEDASASYSSTSTSASASTSTLTGNEQQPAPQGLLSRLQSSIPPDLLTTVQNTQNTLSETLRHAPERVDLSQLRSTFGNELQRMRLHSAAARGEELLRGAGDLLREAVRVVPPDAAGGSGSGTTGVMWDGTDVWTMPGLSGSETPQSDSPVVGKERSLRRSGEVTAIAMPKEALLRALRTNPEILKVDPTVEHRSSQMFETWVKAEVEEKEGGILGMEWNARIEKEMESDGTALKDMKDALVASEMTEDIFWTCYFFRVYQIEQEEIRRKALLQGPVEQEDEFSWEDDDEASSPTTTRPPLEEGQETSAETLTSSTAIPPPSPDKLSAPSPQSLTPGHASATGGAKEGEEEGDESGSDWE